MPPVANSPTPATLTRLLRARDRLHDAPHDAPSVAALAADVRLSRAHFLRSFVRAFGVTPHDYLTAVRLDLAQRALDGEWDLVSPRAASHDR